MPLYFFDFNDDGAPSAPDTMGTDLPNQASVPEEAIAVLANIVIGCQMATTASFQQALETKKVS